MAVTVTHRNKVDFDLGRMLDVLVAAAIGAVQRRTAKGLDVDGRPFPGYAPAYAEALRERGESTGVDLTVTGAYLAGISERSRHIDAARGTAEAVIGPGTGTSEQMAGPIGAADKIARATKRRDKALSTASGLSLSIREAAERDIHGKFDKSVGRARRARKTGRRSPPHNVLARYLSLKFKHLGLSPDDRRTLAALAAKVALKQAGGR